MHRFLYELLEISMIPHYRLLDLGTRATNQKVFKHTAATLIPRMYGVNFPKDCRQQRTERFSFLTHRDTILS